MQKLRRRTKLFLLLSLNFRFLISNVNSVRLLVQWKNTLSVHFTPFSKYQGYKSNPSLKHVSCFVKKKKENGKSKIYSIYLGHEPNSLASVFLSPKWIKWKFSLSFPSTPTAATPSPVSPSLFFPPVLSFSFTLSQITIHWIHISKQQRKKSASPFFNPNRAGR